MKIFTNHLILLFLLSAISVYGQNIVIIESQSYNPGHVMDQVWQTTAGNMGMSASIYPQSTLSDTTFFSTTDALIVSSGVITLTGSQQTTISKFMKSGKSLYLQGEYDCGIYNTNTTFESLINNNGGSFATNGTIAGTLAPMMVLGSLGTTPNTVAPLNYFWYGCRGNACAYVEPFLKYGNDYFGFTFCPPTANYGHVIYTSDQDWVNQSTSIPLMENILTSLTSGNFQCGGANFLTAYLGSDTTICEDSTLTLSSGSSSFTYLWSNGATTSSININSGGTYWLTVSNGLCSATDTIVVTQVSCSGVAPAFSSADTNVCEKFCTSFTDQSTNNPTSWLWLFPGGGPSSSTDQNPSQICYQLPGTYDVTLITTNAGGSDTLTLTDYITVNPTPPVPTIFQNGYILTSSVASNYQWQFNNTDIAGATNQSYNATQTGYYTIITSDDFGCMSSATVYVEITGIEDVLFDAHVSVYPNPSNGNFVVEWSGGHVRDEFQLNIYNTLGQLVFSSAEIIATTALKKEIELPDKSVGVYFLSIKSGNLSLTKKLLVME